MVSFVTTFPGAVLGSIAGKILSSILDKQLARAAAAIAQRSRTAIAALDKSYRDLVRQIEQDFDRLGALTVAAFDLSLNEQLVQRSVELARLHQVDERKLLKSKRDLRTFMLS